MRHATSLALLFLLAAPLAAQTYTGTLSSGSPRRDSGISYESHTVALKEGQKTTIRLESDDFDTYLIVSGPADVQFMNDDFGSINISQVDFIAPATGTYTIWASSYAAGSTGSYTLDVTAGPIATVEVVEGRLDRNDAVLPKGEYADTFERTISTSKPFDVELITFGFDGYLIVQSPSGKWYRNDDDGDIYRSRVADLTPESGTWRIIVTSFSEGEVGAYDLRILTF